MTRPIKISSSSSRPDAVPLLDVARSNDPLRDEVLAAFAEIYDSGRFVGGDACEQFEENFAAFCRTRHAVGCASGSDALLLALMAIGIGPGDEVIVPSFTFFATASAVWRLGAKPVFADVQAKSFNLNPASVAACINRRTRAIIPVHLFGQMADMDAIMALSQEHGIYVVEDAAQAVGARYDGCPAGSIGHIGCFSFYPTKNLGGLGDGGMCTTNDAEIAERIRCLANHGMKPRYVHNEVGINSRLDAMQTAALNIKLAHLPQWADQRRENAMTYDSLFAQHGMTSQLRLPTEGSKCLHVWNQYTVRVEDRQQRDDLRAELSRRNIGTEVYYPIPLHQQTCFASLGTPTTELPVTDKAACQVISLPIFPGLTDHEQRYVVESIAEIFQTTVHSRAA